MKKEGEEVKGIQETVNLLFMASLLFMHLVVLWFSHTLVRQGVKFVEVVMNSCWNANNVLRHDKSEFQLYTNVLAYNM